MAHAVFHTALRGAVMVTLLACGLAWAQAAAGTGAVSTGAASRTALERERIQAKRERLEAQFDAEQALCSERFAVTACVDDVRKRRRAALAVPKAQALALDDAERLERAAARRRAVQDKQRRAAELPVTTPPAPVTAAAPAARGSSSAGTPTAADRALSPRAQDGAASAAAQRRAAGRVQRQLDIKAGQARIEARELARQQSGKAAAPLPTPASSVSTGRR